MCSTQPAIQPSRWASERRTLETSATMSLTVHSMLRGALTKSFPARLFWRVRRGMVMGSVGDACRLPATSLPLIESRVYRVARVAPLVLRRPGRDRQLPPSAMLTTAYRRHPAPSTIPPIRRGRTGVHNLCERVPKLVVGVRCIRREPKRIGRTTQDIGQFPPHRLCALAPRCAAARRAPMMPLGELTQIHRYTAAAILGTILHHCTCPLPAAQSQRPSPVTEGSSKMMLSALTFGVAHRSRRYRG